MKLFCWTGIVCSVNHQPMLHYSTCCLGSCSADAPLTALSVAQWLDCSCQSEPMMISFWSEGQHCDMKRKVTCRELDWQNRHLWIQRINGLIGKCISKIYQTEVAKVIGDKTPKEQLSLCHHLLKWQLPNISHCLSRDVRSDGTSTIDSIQYTSLSSLYLLRQRPLWWDEGHSMLSVMQRTQNSPLSDKIMMETRGCLEKKGLMWCKDLLPGSCMCSGFSLGPRSLLCKINSEWIVKYINLPIYALVLLSLRPSHDLIPDEAFQEWIYWGAFPFVSTSHTTYCLCSSLHLVQIGPVTAPQNVNEDIIFPCTEGMRIQGGMPQTAPEMAQRTHGRRKWPRTVEIRVEEAAAGKEKVAS